MMRLVPTLALLVVISVAVPASAASKYIIAKPAAAQRVDYLVIAADKFADHLDKLAAHREKDGYKVGIVKMSTIKRAGIKRFLVLALAKWTKPAPKYLLLVGDTDTVPAVITRNRLKGWYSSRNIATDFAYARPVGNKVMLHVGRFPCDTPAGLAVMIGKTIDYETTTPGGAWQRQLNFVASVGGYGKMTDTLIEGIAMVIASNMVPLEYDAQAAYGSEGSPYCPDPRTFPEHVVKMMNRGALISLFVGHGSTGSFGSIRGRPMITSATVEKFEPTARSTIEVVIACDGGRFDAADCLGEAHLEAKNGPVAFIGGSRVTQPYANGLFAKALVDAAFGKAATLGEALTQAKQAITLNGPSMFRMQVNMLGGMMQGRKSLEPMRQDVVEHYNLLGDPALKIRRPKRDIELIVKGNEVSIVAPGKAEVELRLECDRLMFRHKLPVVNPKSPNASEQFTERYRLAHDKLVRKWTVPLHAGEGFIKFERPAAPGRYVFKASSGSSVGVATFTVAPAPDVGRD
jgi:peptidase C25-like protein